MQIKHQTLLISILFLLTGCYATISGTVIDAETEKPIEGAVILAEWTKTKGIGHTSTESYKVVETLTDKDGKATIEGVFSLFANYPAVTVYKKGYVAWNSAYIFPDYKKRTDFKWNNGYVFRLERFKPEYTYTDHTFFIHDSINDSLPGNEKKLIRDATRWEELKAFEERRKAK